MIEVEKKFKFTKELDQLLSEAVFVGKIINHDTYYDFPDYRLIGGQNRFRNRNGSYELKLWNKSGGDNEIDNEEEVKKYFNTELSLDEFIGKNLIKFMEYKTERQKYKKEIFTIDVDKLFSYNPDKPEDFGELFFSVCEIELLVENDSGIDVALSKINELAVKYGLVKEKSTKRAECLKKFSPEIYKNIGEFEE